MKHIILQCITLFCIMTGCAAGIDDRVSEVKDPITITSPAPMRILPALSINNDQKNYVSSGSSFAFSCMRAMCSSAECEDMLFSPLSLQYALAMAANGASGTTLHEIVEALGYDGNLHEINAYMNILLEQLPALDDNVEIKVTDALLVNEDVKVLKDFQDIMNKEYYAPVEYVDLDDKEVTVSRVNDWASLCTDGFISPFISADELDENLLALILNALYFKAPWAEVGGVQMFFPEATRLSQPFYRADEKPVSVDYMLTSKYLGYAQKDGYQVVELPYSDGKFAMYILLPDSNDEHVLADIIDRLSEGEWNGLIESLSEGPEVHLSLPKFETTGKYRFKEFLQSLGIEKAFVSDEAEFDKILDGGNEAVYISDIIQKSRIKVTEWGTEAASVTIEQMASALPPEEHDEVFFTADHPFVYTIAERTSGVVLFAGVFAGVQ